MTYLPGGACPPCCVAGGPAEGQQRGQVRLGVGRGDQVEAVFPFGLIGQALDQLLEGKLPDGGLMLDTDGGEPRMAPTVSDGYGVHRGPSNIRPASSTIADRMPTR